MTCKERILSNDYADTLVYILLPEEYNYDLPIDYCYHHLANEWGILYVDRANALYNREGQVAYSVLPKCYGLMECRAAQNGNLNTLSLAESGILSVQGAVSYTHLTLPTNSLV